MNRRNQLRLDLQLVCRVGADRLLSSAVDGVTENFSRGGMLIRWVEAVPLPSVGSHLTIDVQLPPNPDSDRPAGLNHRVMRCRTTVVRIIPDAEGSPSVGLQIENVRFVKTRARITKYDLASMPAATDRVV
jgi:c-di-GMP-binding flagellar brake protein YcgR